MFHFTFLKLESFAGDPDCGEGNSEFEHQNTVKSWVRHWLWLNACDFVTCCNCCQSYCMIAISWHHARSSDAIVWSITLLCSSRRLLKTASLSCRSAAFLSMASVHKVKKLQFVVYSVKFELANRKIGNGAWVVFMFSFHFCRMQVVKRNYN